MLLHVVVALTVAGACTGGDDEGNAPAVGSTPEDGLPTADGRTCDLGGCAPGAATSVGPESMPDETNTGVPDGTRLRRLPNDDYFTIDDPGAVFDGVEIDGCLVVRADDVTIRNSLIRCPGPNSAIWQREGTGGVFEHNTIVGGGPVTAGITGGDMVARGNRITGTIDGIKIGPNSVLEGNWISDLWQGEVSGGPAHNDGIQSQGGSDVVVVGNRIEGPAEWWANGGVFLKQEDGAPPIHRAVISSNWFSGFGYTVRCSFDAECTIANNVFQEGSMLWGPFALDEGATGLIACNTWDDGTTIEGQEAADCPIDPFAETVPG